MRRLCFGGSFNPIHNGHLICARAVAESAGFEQVVLIPAAQPPHKAPQEAMADPVSRLEMCQLGAAEQTDLYVVSDIEVHRGGPSYTLDTVRQLKAAGWPEVHWLIGADMLLYLPKWHEAERLVTECQFVVMERPGWSIDWSALPSSFRHLQHQVVVAPLVSLSATEIRRRVAAGRSIAYLTPPAVQKYIRDKGLYR